MNTISNPRPSLWKFACLEDVKAAVVTLRTNTAELYGDWVVTREANLGHRINNGYKLASTIVVGNEVIDTLVLA